MKGTKFMNIGIIVYSHTGNTLSVAQRLKDRLTGEGNTVAIEQVEAVNEDPRTAVKVVLKTIPDISKYDVLLFGSPVHGFSLAPVMKEYLSQVPSLKGKKVGCFVTHQLPFQWMGGTKTIKQMQGLCEAKGESVYGAGIVNWSSKQREKNIDDVLERLAEMK
jgi:flavodoxin